MRDTPLAQKFRQLTLENQIAELIEHPNLNMNGIFPFIFDTKAAIQESLKWIEDPSNFVYRLEDLVGPSGGGNRNKQIETLHSLAKHMGCDLTHHRIEEIADNLF